MQLIHCTSKIQKEMGLKKAGLCEVDPAQIIEDMEIPGFKLHGLKGRLKGRWSIWVNGNWRITFEFQDGNAFILDYEDYH